MAGSTVDQSRSAAARRAERSFREVKDFIIREESAVEVVNVIHSEVASAGGHGREELPELARKAGRAATLQGEHFVEEVVRKQADAIGK